MSRHNHPLLPLGKLPTELLARILKDAPAGDPEVILGPGVGLDCAIVRLGDHLLALKSDPITFATDDIGWYAVQVNANDIVTTGAVPRWFLATVLLPEGYASEELAVKIAGQLFSACRDLRIAIVGGHTEITHGLGHPVVAGTMIGLVSPEGLITPQGAEPGDRILLTKGVPIEATAILAREFTDRLGEVLSRESLLRAQNYLYQPGISVVEDARLAAECGQVTAMHDPTEGGLYTALWELSEACGNLLIIDPDLVPVSELSAQLCQSFGLDPLGAIASGALLITASPGSVKAIIEGLKTGGIPCTEIGYVSGVGKGVKKRSPSGLVSLPRPERDEIARLFQSG